MKSKKLIVSQFENSDREKQELTSQIETVPAPGFACVASRSRLAVKYGSGVDNGRQIHAQNLKSQESRAVSTVV